MQDQKIAFTFKVLRVLQTTDERRPLNAKQIIERLNLYYNTECRDRRHIYEAIDCLGEMGFKIIRCDSTKAGYYLLRGLSLCELKLRIDTINQSKCFTAEDKKRLVAEIFANIPAEYRRVLVRQPVIRSKFQQTATPIMRYMDEILMCIAYDRQIQFQYLAYSIEMQPYLKHNMKMYRISPYMLYASSDTCYLIGAEYEPEDNIDQIKYFRLDRISTFSMLDIPRRDIRNYYRNDAMEGLTQYVSECIDHYGREEVRLVLEVEYSETAMYIIRDMCGNNGFLCQSHDDRSAVISFMVATGPTLIGWLMQNARHFTVLGPEQVVRELREEYEWGWRKYGGR